MRMADGAVELLVDLQVPATAAGDSGCLAFSRATTRPRCSIS